MLSLTDDPTVPQAVDPTTISSRPPRIDKGTIELTDRDLRCLRWIGEQYTMRFDLLQHLLRVPARLARKYTVGTI